MTLIGKVSAMQRLLYRTSIGLRSGGRYGTKGMEERERAVCTALEQRKNYFFLLTAAFSSAPGVNFATFLAAILIGFPV